MSLSTVPALMACDLNLSFGHTQILTNFSLQLDQGDILCLLGPSGCGKTTALKTIAGLHRTHSGRIQLFANTVVDGHYNLAPQQRQIGFIFQDYALFPHMTVADNIAYGIHQLDKKEQQQRISNALNLVELSTLAQRYPHELSGGQQQRIALARALAARPKLLLMDEPFSNVDAQVKRRMMADLRALLKHAGISVIFVTHAKDEAFAFADKTAVMINGQIQQYGTPAQVYQQPINADVARFMEAGNVCDLSQITEYIECVLNTDDKVKNTGFALFKRHLITIKKSATGNAIIKDIQFTGRGYLLTMTFSQRPKENWQAEMDSLPDCAIGDTVTLHYGGEYMALN